MLYAGDKSAAGVGKSKSSCACIKEGTPVCGVVGLQMRDYGNPCLAECEYVGYLFLSVCMYLCLYV